MITLRSLAAVLSGLFLLAITVLVAVLVLDSAALKGRFEAWASDQLGRQLAIDGDFQLELGPVVTFSASGVRLANVAWGSQPEMLVAKRVLVQLDVRSLFRDTVIFPRIEVDGLDVLLERNTDGENNWKFALPPRDETTIWPETPPVVVELVAMPGARLRFIGPRLTRPLDVRFDTLEQHPAPDDMLVFNAAGQANDVPLHLGATVGPLANLLKGEQINFGLNGELGELTLAGHGHIDDLGTPVDTELALNVSGPDADYVTRVLGVRNLGTGPVRLDASIAPAADRRGITATLSGEFGALSIDGSSDIVDPASLEKLALKLQLAGPDLSLIGGLLEINQLPAEAFTLELRFERNDDALTIEAAALRLKDAELELQGSVEGMAHLTGNDVTFTAKGSDLARIRSLLRIPGFATGPFDLAGRLKQSTGGKELLKFTANTQLGKFTATGPLGDYPGFYDSVLQFTVAGPEFGLVGRALKIDGLPTGPFDAQGQFEWTRPGVIFRKTTLKVAGDQLTVDGLLGMQPVGSQVDLNITMQGRDPRLLAWFIGQPELPAVPYTVSGRLRHDKNAWRVDGVDAALAGARLRVNGQVGNPPAMHGTNVSFVVEGPDLAPFSGVAGRKLPRVPFRAAGNLASVADAVRLQELTVSVGGLKVGGGVTVGVPVSSSATEFDLNATGPGLDKLLPELSWLPLTHQAAAVTAKGTWRKDRLSMAALKVVTETENVSARGDVTLAPIVQAQGLQVTATSSNLATAGQLVGIKLPAGFRLPATTLQFTTTLSGNADALVLDALQGTVGDSDFKGRVQLDLTGKPSIDMELQSKVLNLTPFSAEAPQATTARSGATERTIPDVTLPLDGLNQLNGHFNLQAGNLQVAGTGYAAFHMNASIKDGNLTADPVQITNANGALSGRLEVQQGAGLPLVRAVASFKDLTLGLGQVAKNPMEQLQYDGRFDLTGRGRTLRDLAGSLQGRIRLVSGTGRLPNSRFTSVYSSFLSELFTTLNPLAKRQPYTNVVCAAYLLRADNGILYTDPALVLRTDAIDVISNGSINLRSEDIDFNFKTVARSGFGISLGQLVNPYIKVTGTMAKPRLTLDPTGSLVTGGAAFATGGLSILATTVWDRLFRQTDPCASAIAEADKRAAATAP